MSETTISLEAINAELVRLGNEEAPIRRAIASAGQMGVEDLQQAQETIAKRRNVIADWMLGLTNRAAVDEVQREAKAAEAAQAKARQDRELARLGADELEQRLEPICHRQAELRRQLSIAIRTTIRKQAEAAGVAYLRSIEDAARAYAKLQAYAEVLNDMEGVGIYGAMPPDGGSQSFGGSTGPQRMDFPVYPELQAFRACVGPILPVVFRNGIATPGTQLQVDYSQVLSAVKHDLAAQGLPVR